MGKTHRKLGCTFMLIFAFAPLVRAQDGQAARGRYLVENVALCGDCHTPTLPNGLPDLSRFLKGAALTFQSIQPIPKWNANSPDIAPGGAVWKNWGEGGLRKFLQTGLGPRGHPADPPMPSYKFSAQDAEAVVAYLKTLR
jgi:mono/diheme cytochrome c family protein